ncbi:hypothetical protein [Allorhizocola rhizosphaerae]|uniref:hypothetical protein n=1 Tax=Allorhizocola rhizosphaerae TaxID=1872709 RepID=UPI000E3E602C|nr:hypothetical protein [Allorhizocola rhizosphaerae]
MIFVEVFSPRGALSPQERWQLAERLMTDVSFEDPALPMAMETAIGNAEVIVHEPEAWTVGGRPDERPRFLVRVSVPEEWREDISRYLGARLTRVLRGAPGSSADVTIQVFGVAGQLPVGAR